MTFISLDLKTDVYTFLDKQGRAVELTPLQVFNKPKAVNSLPLSHQSLLAQKLMASATKSA